MISIYWRNLEEHISAAIVVSSFAANYLTAPGFLFILASDFPREDAAGKIRP